MYTIDIVLFVALIAITLRTVVMGWKVLPETTTPAILGFIAVTAVLAMAVGYIGLEFTSLGVLAAGGSRAFFDVLRRSSVHG